MKKMYIFVVSLVFKLSSLTYAPNITIKVVTFRWFKIVTFYFHWKIFSLNVNLSKQRNKLKDVFISYIIHVYWNKMQLIITNTNKWNINSLLDSNF